MGYHPLGVETVSASCHSLSQESWISMRSSLALLCTSVALLATTTTAQIYDNGSIVNFPGGGAGGTDASALQNVPPLNHTVYGHTSNNASFTLADDFTVCGTWTVTGVTLYAYQTGAGSGTFTAAYVRIWKVDPRTATTPPYTSAQVAYGDLTAAMTTNLITSPPVGTLVAYRTLIGNYTTDTQRQVNAIPVTITPTTLTPGTYWLEFGVSGSGASGPFTPPLTELDVQGTGNGIQRTVSTNVWAPTVNGTNPGSEMGIPFTILGTAVGQVVASAGTFGAGKAGTNGVGSWSLGTPVRTPILGRDYPMRLVNGFAGSAPIVALGTPLVSGVPFPPVGTVYVLPIFATLAMPAFDNLNVSLLRLPIPHGANLCGLNLGAQAFWGDPGAAGSIAHSNGLDLTLGN